MTTPDPKLEDTIAVIRDQYNALSSSQQKVTEFLLENGLNVIHYTVTQIADDLRLNPSTVVRTAQSLGYSGFPEFQNALRKDLMRRAGLSERLQIGSQQLIDGLLEGKTTSGEKSIFEIVLREEVDNMLKLTEHVPIEDFETAVNYLDTSKQVFILGLGTSLALALNFGNILRYARSDIHIIKPGTDPIPGQLEMLSADDLLFTICVARYTRETLLAMEYAQQLGATVITLTDSLVSPASTRADLSLIVPYRLWLYGNSVAMFALLNGIMGALFIRNPEAAKNRLKHLDNIFGAFQIHHDDKNDEG